MSVLEQASRFSDRYGRTIAVGGTTWRYHVLGTGSPILWLTGGLRRSALGFGLLERLSERHLVIAPDYPPVRTIGAFLAAFDAMLEAESVDRLALAGQSYGGMLAQAYLARRPEAIERLVLSSTGPADYGKAWLPVEIALVTATRVLPEMTVKRLLVGGLLKIVTLPETERAYWLEAIRTLVERNLSRDDVTSHFAVAGDLIQKGIVRPGVYSAWKGRVVVLAAENDPTQSRKDFPRYERLFGRQVERVSMGDMGHTAALSDPDRYVALVEEALAERPGAPASL